MAQTHREAAFGGRAALPAVRLPKATLPKATLPKATHGGDGRETQESQARPRRAMVAALLLGLASLTSAQQPPVYYPLSKSLEQRPPSDRSSATTLPYLWLGSGPTAAQGPPTPAREDIFQNDPVAALPEELVGEYGDGEVFWGAPDNGTHQEGEEDPYKGAERRGRSRDEEYANDVPQRVASKGDDENYDESPSGGVWGHDVLDPPQWSRHPKIYRGKKRAKNNRKKKIKGGARITASSHYELQYILGRKIIFQCVARGKPRPRITWYKDGVELYAHNYFQVHEWHLGAHKLKSKMEIDPATPMDEGYYKCEANNERGIDQAGFRTKYRH